MLLDKETRVLLDELNQNPPDLHDQQVDVETSREGLRALFLGYETQTPICCDWQEVTATQDGLEIPLRIYQPKQRTEKLPVVMFIHGGGWCLGDLESYHKLVADLTERSNAVFVSVDYRLAPEHKYPAGLEDCRAVSQWIVENIHLYGGDESQLAIMGDSAGGNLALVTSHLLNQQLPDSVKSLYLVYPVLDSVSEHSRYQSREVYGQGDYLLANQAISDTRDWYVSDNAQAKSESVSPLFIGDLTHLPPTSIMLAGCDPLYSEGVALADKLKQQQRLRRLQCYESTIHAFLSLGVLPVSQEARTALSNMVVTDFA